MSYTREKSINSFIAALVFVIVIAACAVAGFLVFGGEAPAEEDAFPWIVSDSAVIGGMLDGTYYNGEKNPSGVLSYKIAEEINIGSDGKGDFKIENSGKNSCLIKVTVYVNGSPVYSTGYIKPNEHISEDSLDTPLTVGTYAAEAVFEGFDPNTESSIGAVKENITITVIP